MRARLSTLIYATLLVYFATILLLFLPALRSYLSTEGPIDEAREDLAQVLALERFTYLVERRSVESLDVVFARKSLDDLRDADTAIAEVLATLRRTAEAEAEPEADELATLEALEGLDRRLRADFEVIHEASLGSDRATLIEQARAAWERQRREISGLLATAQLQEGDAVNDSLDALLAASGQFAFVPFLPLEPKTRALRVSTTAARGAARFLACFELLAGEYATAALLGTSRARLESDAILADLALADWRLYAGSHAEAPGVPFDEIETLYRRFREAGESLLARPDPDRLDAYREQLEPLTDAGLTELLEAAVADYQERQSVILEEIERQLKLTGAVIAVLTAALATLMLASPWILSRWVVRPISELSEAARALGQGDLSRRVSVRGSREILELTKSFNRTAEDLGEIQERLKRQERLAVLGELAGSIGHEIRNPLGAMTSSIYFLRMRRDKTIDAKAEEHLERIERQIRRADRIITELLDYARNPVTSPRSVDLDHVLDEVMAAVAVPSGVRVERAGGGCPRALADPEQVGRVLENLVRNALQAMPDGGELRLACAARGAEVVLSVADTGVGIPAESLPKIFEPLFTSKVKGIGLGLAVSQRYAELNGGRIECESELGRGSLFRLVLPADEAARED